MVGGTEGHREKIAHALHRRQPFRWVPVEAGPLHDLGDLGEDPATACTYLMREGLIATDRPRVMHPARPSRRITVFRA
jgi:hypothetical protein